MFWTKTTYCLVTYLHVTVAAPKGCLILNHNLYFLLFTQEWKENWLHPLLVNVLNHRYSTRHCIQQKSLKFNNNFRIFSEDVEYAVIVGISKCHICVCRPPVLWDTGKFNHAVATGVCLSVCESNSPCTCADGGAEVQLIFLVLRSLQTWRWPRLESFQRWASNGATKRRLSVFLSLNVEQK